MISAPVSVRRAWSCGFARSAGAAAASEWRSESEFSFSESSVGSMAGCADSRAKMLAAEAMTLLLALVAHCRATPALASAMAVAP